MKFSVRPALPDIHGNNDAPLTRQSSTYKSGNVVQTSGATSLRCTGRQGWVGVLRACERSKFSMNDRLKPAHNTTGMRLGKMRLPI